MMTPTERIGRKRPQVVATALTVGILLIGACGRGGGSGPSSIEINEEPGTLIGGSMAFDGTHIWTMSITQGFDTNAVRKIIKINMNGEIVDSFQPDENISGDLCFDGETLRTGYAFGWEAGAVYADHKAIYAIDPETKELTNEFSLPEFFDDLDGLTATPGTLWAMVMKRDEERVRVEYLYKIDLVTRRTLEKYEFTEFNSCTGIAFLDGDIWALTGTFSKDLFQIDTQTGTIENVYDLEYNVINGILSMNEGIYLFDEEEDLLYRFEAPQ
ncbi:hypothetical protein GF402_11190 [Candidatus Fermentibacteria bacterium]|nr:hypothetical protein [Candidatus Fermentibacteria bacterium]